MDCFQSVYLPDSAVSDADLPDLNPVNLDAMPSQMSCQNWLTLTFQKLLHGPDNLSGFIINSWANVLCDPLTHLF